MNETVYTKYRVHNFEVTKEDSLLFGKHESGIVNIPDGEFTKEQMSEWLKDGTLVPYVPYA